MTTAETLPPPQCDHPPRTWRELGPEDAATVRRLYADTKTRKRPYVPRVAAESREARTMMDVAQLCDQLAGVGAADPEKLRRMARWLRRNRPKPSPAAPLDEPGSPWTASTTKALFAAWIRKARNAGYTLESIGYVAGLTRERVRQIAAQMIPVDPADVPPVVGLPRPAEDLPWPTVLDKKWLAWPRPTLSAAESAELMELHQLGTQLRGGVPADDPRRLARHEFVRRVNFLIEKRGFTHREVGDIVGLTFGAIRMTLSKHGYRTLPPSQKAYAHRGVS